MRTLATLLLCCFSVSSCSVPGFFPSENCACSDGSGKIGPKGERCGETLKEKTAKRGYYGEIQMSESSAYYSKDCRTAE